MEDSNNPIQLKDGNGARSVYVALYFIGAVLSGAGGNYLWMRNVGPDVIAPDRFTGSEASQLESRVGRVERDIAGHIGTHPSQVDQYDRRIATLEAQYVLLLANQQRIIDKLDEK